MNNLEKILEMWKKDSPIDEMRLDESSRDSAKLHAKYLELYSVNKIKLKKLDINIREGYKNYSFQRVFQELFQFCTVDLSAFYFDIRKDLLYCDPINSDKRSDCIKVLNIILQCLLKWFAPILSFTTEEIFKLLNQNSDKQSIHLENFIKIPSNWFNENIEHKWDNIKKIRDEANISIETKRASKEIGSSLEAKILIKLNKDYTI